VGWASPASPAHVRFSIWEDGVARGAVSIAEDEAARLAEFLETEAVTQPLEPQL
jgi:hypothetical protein